MTPEAQIRRPVANGNEEEQNGMPLWAWFVIAVVGVFAVIVVIALVRGAYNWATTPSQPATPTVAAKVITLRTFKVHGGSRPEVYKPIIGSILGEHKIIEDANLKVGGTLDVQVTVDKAVTVGLTYETLDGKSYYSSATDQSGRQIANLDAAARQAIAGLVDQLRAEGFTVDTSKKPDPNAPAPAK